MEDVTRAIIASFGNFLYDDCTIYCAEADGSNTVSKAVLALSYPSMLPVLREVDSDTLFLPQFTNMEVLQMIKARITYHLQVST